jgi:dienelactone hydrolase
LLIHDWDGLTDYEVKRSEMLAEMGYSVFAADLFGAGERPTQVVDKRQHTGALEKAASLGANINNAVAMGYCFGGAAVLELARSGADLKGFATFHGGLKNPGLDSTNFYSRSVTDRIKPDPSFIRNLENNSLPTREPALRHKGRNSFKGKFGRP